MLEYTLSPGLPGVHICWALKPTLVLNAAMMCCFSSRSALNSSSKCWSSIWALVPHPPPPPSMFVGPWTLLWCWVLQWCVTSPPTLPYTSPLSAGVHFEPWTPWWKYLLGPKTHLGVKCCNDVLLLLQLFLNSSSKCWSTLWALDSLKPTLVLSAAMMCCFSSSSALNSSSQC